MLNKEIKVLDKGFVRLVDSMGNDSSVVQAARVSYGDGTKSVSDDKALIRYLMRHKHTSPFEMVIFKFHIKCPIFVMRQLIRHRTASVNELSGRYSVMKDEFYVPDPLNIATQSSDNKQGRGTALEYAKAIDSQESFKTEAIHSFDLYNKRLDEDMARELARINLPLSTYTEFYWQMNLHNLLHFLRLRMDKHAQLEIREYANVIFDIVKTICPESVSAFEDYVLNAKTFSKKEIELLLSAIPNPTELFSKEKVDGLSKREYLEFLEKLS